MTTTVTTKLDEMWQALEAHQPKPEYAEAWATMCRERTEWAAWAAARAAARDAAWAAAAEAAEAAALAAAWAVAGAAAWAVARADRYAQEAIDAIKEVKP